MMKEEVICIICPRGCRLQVDPENDYKVTGNACPRGIPYGKSELKNPTRVITSTVVIDGDMLTRCPVKTDQAISKAKMKEAMYSINQIRLKAPVKVGDIVIERIVNSDANVVVCRDIG